MTEAKVLRIQPTATFGPAYTLEFNGAKCNICYWEADNDGLSEEKGEKNESRSSPEERAKSDRYT